MGFKKFSASLSLFAALAVTACSSATPTQAPTSYPTQVQSPAPTSTPTPVSTQMPDYFKMMLQGEMSESDYMFSLIREDPSVEKAANAFAEAFFDVMPGAVPFIESHVRSKYNEQLSGEIIEQIVREIPGFIDEEVGASLFPALNTELYATGVPLFAIFDKGFFSQAYFLRTNSDAGGIVKLFSGISAQFQDGISVGDIEISNEYAAQTGASSDLLTTMISASSISDLLKETVVSSVSGSYDYSPGFMAFLSELFVAHRDFLVYNSSANSIGQEQVEILEDELKIELVQYAGRESYKLIYDFAHGGIHFKGDIDLTPSLGRPV